MCISETADMYQLPMCLRGYVAENAWGREDVTRLTRMWQDVYAMTTAGKLEDEVARIPMRVFIRSLSVHVSKWLAVQVRPSFHFLYAMQHALVAHDSLAAMLASLPQDAQREVS
jgi:hypothetical protein